jgi:hypothetical protein
MLALPHSRNATWRDYVSVQTLHLPDAGFAKLRVITGKNVFARILRLYYYYRDQRKMTRPHVLLHCRSCRKNGGIGGQGPGKRPCTPS